VSAQFVHLHLHTEYSIGDSIVRVKDLARAVADAGMPAVAMTDRANLFAMVKFYRAAMAHGVKPIIGAEVLVRDPALEDSPAPLVLLCKDRDGFHCLSGLLTRAYLEGQQGGVPVVELDWLAKATGLLALSGGRDGATGRAIIAGREADARAIVTRMAELFDGDYYLELQRTARTGEDSYNRGAVTLAAEMGIPVVATNDVRFLKSDDVYVHEARVCIHQGRMLGDNTRAKEYSPQQYLRSPAEMAELFADLPEALENAVEIARRCNLVLELGDAHLPAYAVPDGYDIDSFLVHESRRGVARRLALGEETPLQDLPAVYRERLQVELDVISRMGFPGYFLIVADFIQWARKHEIPVGPGRGSGAGSLVAYGLGITDIDPIEHALLFERFLNPERVSMPDFDIDFCMEGRDRVIEYVAERYGRDRVSQIITYGRMAAKAVVRDAGRVLGHAYGFVDRVAKLIPNDLGITLDKALSAEPELKQLYATDEEVRSILDLARGLEGLVRNAGKHAGGVVIAPADITTFSPLYRVEGEKGAVTQFDKDDVEAAGLVKFDFLGLRTLTIIDWAVQTVNAQQAGRDDELLDIASLTLDDPDAFRLLRECRTTAVFQLESRGMRDLIKRLQPDTFEDIVALVALYRPGPLQSGMVDDFIDRKHGDSDQAIDYLHPDLEPVLKATYGVILYQEQVMQIAQVLAGYSLGEADLLRRAMGKKKPEEMAKQRSVFMAGAAGRGVQQATAGRIFDLMEKFAGYGFNKSHSAAYAVLSYQTAWLKAHHTAAFMAAVLTSEIDDTDKLNVLRRDCEAEGLDLLPPDINDSAYAFEVRGDSAIRYGLGAIKGLGRSAVESIVAAREDGPFTGLDDFCQRVDAQRIGRRGLEALAKAGALDAMGPNRPSLLAALPAAQARAERMAQDRDSGQGDMFGDGGAAPQPPPPMEPADDWGLAAHLEAERESLGLYLSGHPFDQYRSDAPFVTTGTIASMTGAPPAKSTGDGWNGGREASLAGLVTGLRKRGGRVTFDLDDGRERIEVTLFQEAFERFRHLLVSHAIVVISGKLRFDDFIGDWRLTAREVIDIDRLVEDRASGLVIRWCGREGRVLDPGRLHDTLDPYRPGRCDVSLHVEQANAQARVRFGEGWSVRPSRELRERLSALVGAEGYRFLYDASAPPV
jgi:DNA polymerase-3 subunit alpha